LRPLGVPAIIDAAIRLLTRHARTLFVIAAVVMLPISLLEYVVGVWASGIVTGAETIPTTTDPEVAFRLLFESLGPLVLAGLVAGVIAVLAQLAVQLGSVKAIADIYLGREPQWRESLGYGFRRLPTAVLAFLIALVPLLVGFVLCLLPGIALATLWSLTPVTIAAEGQGAASGLSRSFDLVKKRFWPILGVLVLAVLVTAILSSILGAIANAAILASGDLQVGLQTLLNLIARLVTTPFMVAVLTVAYFDLRIRQEGLDLELLTQRMQADS